MSFILAVDVWIITRRADNVYIDYFTDFDDIPDEYVDNDSEYAILKQNAYTKVNASERNYLGT